jgi:hypothetical protein
MRGGWFRPNNVQVPQNATNNRHLYRDAKTDSIFNVNFKHRKLASCYLYNIDEKDRMIEWKLNLMRPILHFGLGNE